MPSQSVNKQADRARTNHHPVGSVRLCFFVVVTGSVTGFLTALANWVGPVLGLPTSVVAWLVRIGCLILLLASAAMAGCALVITAWSVRAVEAMEREAEEARDARLGGGRQNYEML